eukprot:gene19406-25281_t
MAKGFNVSAQSKKPINDNNKNDLNDDFPEEIVQSGIQILCEYIDDELSHKFIEFIGKDSSILVSKLKPATKRKSDWENELEIEKQTMSFASGNPSIAKASTKGNGRDEVRRIQLEKERVERFQQYIREVNERRDSLDNVTQVHSHGNRDNYFTPWKIIGST